MKTLILDKTFRILEALTNAENPLSLKEICLRTQVSPPAASRILKDLTENGYLHKVTYRTFEPGLGMIALGQSSLRHNFFPQKAIQLLRNRLEEHRMSGALAGMFHNRLVYLYHSKEQIRHNAFSTLNQQIYGSNIALVILCVKEGPEKAFELLCENLRLQEKDQQKVRKKTESIRNRIESFGKDHFTVWLDDGETTNLCFPLADRQQIYGLSFLLSPEDTRDRTDFFLKGSLIATEMRKILSRS